MNFIIFIFLLAIIILLYLIFIRATELVNLMTILVNLVEPKSIEYDEKNPPVSSSSAPSEVKEQK